MSTTYGEWSVLNCQVCSDLPPEEMVAHVNSDNPTGISSPWHLSDGFVSAPCPEREGHVHYVLVC